MWRWAELNNGTRWWGSCCCPRWVGALLFPTAAPCHGVPATLYPASSSPPGRVTISTPSSFALRPSSSIPRVHARTLVDSLTLRRGWECGCAALTALCFSLDHGPRRVLRRLLVDSPLPGAEHATFGRSDICPGPQLLVFIASRLPAILQPGSSTSPPFPYSAARSSAAPRNGARFSHGMLWLATVQAE